MTRPAHPRPPARHDDLRALFLNCTLNTTFMAWNLMHLARLLKDAGGVPAHGNQPAAWAAGCRFDHPGPAGTSRQA